MPLERLLRRLEIKPKISVLVVFDLDSTLFDVSFRTQRIFNDFAKEKKEEFFKECELLAKVKVMSKDWGWREALKRQSLDKDQVFLKSFESYWKKHFFSNKYLEDDRPYAGAVDFVNKLGSKGAALSYLTGRKKILMEEGTRRVLVQSGFPLEGCQLFMKETDEFSDSVYKSRVLKRLAKDHDEVWFFENDPTILLKVEEECPTAQLVFVNTTHSGKTPSPSHLPVIEGHYRWTR